MTHCNIITAAGLSRLWLTPYHILLLSLLLLLSVLCLIPAAQASSVIATKRVELISPGEVVNIAPYMYRTIDQDAALSYDALIQNHENNKRGVRPSGSNINLGVSGQKNWFVFSVTNHTDQKEWVLDFGEIYDGRTGFLRQLFVKNHSQNTAYVSIGGQEGKTELVSYMDKSSAKIILPPNKTSLIALSIQMDSGFTSMIQPQLKSVSYHYNTVSISHILSIFTGLFFMVMAGFFIAVSYIRANPNYLAFSAFYVLSGLLFTIIDHGFYKGLFVNAHFADLIFFGSLICAAFATKGFLKITDEDTLDHKIFLGALVVLCASFLCKTFLSQYSAFVGVCLFSIPVAIAFLALSFTSFNQSQYGKYGAMFLCVAWVFPALGVLFSELSSNGILGAHSIVMNSYWLSLFAHAGFFIAATIQKIKMLDEEERQSYIIKSKKALKKAKDVQEREAADQAKLLRVIERERELMAGLRELEIHRAEEMRRAKEEADEANRAKSAFLAVVSHEVRTPMTGILGMVRLLLESKLSSEQNDFVLALQKSGETMMALLNDILDFEKIESGSMELEYLDFNLPQLAKDVVTLMSGHAAGKDIYLTSDIDDSCPNYVLGDPTRLRQVLLNLVNNAIKFTEEGGVTIELRARKVDGKTQGIRGDYEIYCGIKDTGIGISEEAQQALFNPFSQADSSISRKYGGTGLGLTICKKLIEAMGSTINITSVEGEGSTFHFTLLMEEGSADVAESSEGQEQSKDTLPTKRILVVEDNEMNRKVLQGLLDRLGQITTMAEDGAQAIAACKNESFDLVFMDIQLPDMTGVEATQALREIQEHNTYKTPIIALTGNVMLDDIKSYYDASMNGFLAKPIDHDKLYEAILNVHRGKLENPLPSDESEEQDHESADGMATPFAFAPAQNEENVDPIITDVTNDGVEEIEPLAEQDITPLTSLDLDNTPVSELMIDDGNTAPIEEPVPSTSETDVEATPDVEVEQSDLLDYEMLNSLMTNLGKEQCKGLMDGFLEKTDELVQAIEELAPSKDMAQIGARAHELKGMAANFGLQSLGQDAGVIEKLAKDQEIETALELIKTLSAAKDQSKTALSEWLAQG